MNCLYRFICILSFLNLGSVINCQQYNPIIPDLIADPTICDFDSVFYCYATTDGYNKGLSTSGPPVVWKSKDFVNWSFSGILFPSADNQLYWAPSNVHNVFNKYYFYPTVNNDIYTAVADSPEGPFKLANGVDSFKSVNSPKPLITFKGPKGTKGIDAHLFYDNNNQGYIFWAQRGGAKLNKDMVSIDSASVIQIATKRKGYSEGPFLFERKGIYYYCYTLSGHENYQYAYGMSKISPLGPFDYPAQDIIASTNKSEDIYGPGHGCIFNLHGTDDYYFVYLEFGRGGTNRQIFANKVEFNLDGTIVPIQLNRKGIGYLRTSVYKKNLTVRNAIASGSSGDKFIKPVKDTSLHRIENFKPLNAFDNNNGTRWMAAEGDSLNFLIADLGKTIKINESELFFVKPTQIHNYSLQYSLDGVSWKFLMKYEGSLIQSPFVDKIGLKARFLKVTVLKGEKGLWEWKIF